MTSKISIRRAGILFLLALVVLLGALTLAGCGEEEEDLYFCLTVYDVIDGEVIGEPKVYDSRDDWELDWYVACSATVLFDETPTRPGCRFLGYYTSEQRMKRERPTVLPC